MWKDGITDIEMFYRIALQFIKEMKKSSKVGFDMDKRLIVTDMIHGYTGND